MKPSLAAAIVASCLAFGGVSSAQQAQPIPMPVRVQSPTNFEASLTAGTTISARWDLPADSTGTPFVLAQTVRNQTEYACVAAAFVNGAWVTSAVDKEPGDDDPTTCLSAVRVNNRWAIARWSLGGHGDGRGRVNESSLSLLALVNGSIQQVWTGAVHGFARLPSGPVLSLVTVSPRREILEWSADGQRLAPRGPAGRPTPPARPPAARR